jgi:hypothetical protein
MKEAEMVRVEELSFRKSAPQLWHDSWRNRDRVCRFKGKCIVCARRCYEFDDGENDPRGALGDHSNYGVGPDDGDFKREHPACFLCMNDEPRYREALRLAALAEKKGANR